jgi:hypothetical protein
MTRRKSRLLAATSQSLHALIFWRFAQGLFVPGVIAVMMAYINEEFAGTRRRGHVRLCGRHGLRRFSGTIPRRHHRRALELARRLRDVGNP